MYKAIYPSPRGPEMEPVLEEAGGGELPWCKRRIYGTTVVDILAKYIYMYFTIDIYLYIYMHFLDIIIIIYIHIYISVFLYVVNAFFFADILIFGWICFGGSWESRTRGYVIDWGKPPWARRIRKRAFFQRRLAKDSQSVDPMD